MVNVDCPRCENTIEVSLFVMGSTLQIDQTNLENCECRQTEGWWEEIEARAIQAYDDLRKGEEEK